MQAGYERVIHELDTRDLLGTAGWGGGYNARCPAHADSRASLVVKEGEDGRALVYCHAGCNTADVCAALNLDVSDLFTGSDGSAVADTYVYQDEDGNPLSRVLRYSPKGFSQQRRDGSGWASGLQGVRRVLYRLPELRASRGDVYVTEGEKDAESLAALGHTATCSLGGAGKWKPEYSSELRGRNVIICADNDEVGIKSARSIEAALQGLASSAVVVVPVEGKDVTDHLDAGLTVSDLRPVDIDVDVLAPVDWETYVAEETQWLYKPYLPRQGRVLAFGPPGSLKSLWAMWVAAKLTHEGQKVAYFSLEMRASESARRISQARPRKDNFTLYTKFNFNNAEQLVTIQKALRGYDLIVIDSWSSAHDDTNNNDAVARLDNDVFQPIIEATGATLLILDNVGHPSMGKDGTRVQSDWARGASAKGDKMEVTIFFQRPDENDNYRTQLSVKKMRLDHPMPPTEDIWTESDTIEFYEMAGKIRSRTPVWNLGGGDATGDSATEKENVTVTAPESAVPAPKPLTPLQEELALARVKDKLGAVELTDVLGTETIEGTADNTKGEENDG